MRDASLGIAGRGGSAGVGAGVGAVAGGVVTTAAVRWPARIAAGEDEGVLLAATPAAATWAGALVGAGVGVAGAAALALGLIDGLGDLRSVMRGRFGEKVRLRVVQQERGMLRRLGLRAGYGNAPALEAGAHEAFADALVAAARTSLDDWAAWAKLGL